MNLFTPFNRLLHKCEAQVAADKVIAEMDDLQDTFHLTVTRIKTAPAQCDRREHPEPVPLDRRKVAAR